MGRLLAAVGVMLAARKGAGGGILTGACAGVALDLASGEQPYYSMVFAMAGLACGLCKNHRKIWAALAYVLTCFLAVLWSWDGGVHLGLPMEAVVGAILFLVIPFRLKEEKALPAETGSGTGPDLGDQPAGCLPENGGDGFGLSHPLRQREGDPPPRGQ